jgi:hypothetical protein
MGTFHYPLFALFACCFVRVGPCLSLFGRVQVYIISCEGHFTFLNSPVDVQTYDDHNRVMERLVERFRKKKVQCIMGFQVGKCCCDDLLRAQANFPISTQPKSSYLFQNSTPTLTFDSSLAKRFICTFYCASPLSTRHNTI